MAVRAKDARLLRWSDIGETSETLIEPSKTRDSSGAKIAIALTAEIQATLDRMKVIWQVKSLYVFHTLRGLL